jgi:hypothetical protein
MDFQGSILAIFTVQSGSVERRAGVQNQCDSSHNRRESRPSRFASSAPFAHLCQTVFSCHRYSKGRVHQTIVRFVMLLNGVAFGAWRLQSSYTNESS